MEMLKGPRYQRRILGLLILFSTAVQPQGTTAREEGDIDAQVLALSREERQKLVEEMDKEELETYLGRLRESTLIALCKRACGEMKDYTAILYKQERLRGRLQGVEKIQLKFRDSPRGIYMKWLDGPWEGREALYSEQALGPSKVRLRERGALGVLPVTLGVDGRLSGRGTNHKITETGLCHLIQMIEKDHIRAVAESDYQRINHGFVELGGRTVYKMESVLSEDPSDGYYCYRVVHYIDLARALDLRVEIYGWDNQLMEAFQYDQLKANQGLTDRDFSPKNPAYRLR